MHFFHNSFVSSVLKSSCINVYTPVLRAVLPCSCKKIPIFRIVLANKENFSRNYYV